MVRQSDEYFLQYFQLLNLFLQRDATVSLLRGRDKNLILLFYKGFVALNRAITTNNFDEYLSNSKILKSYLFDFLNESVSTLNINLECEYLKKRDNQLLRINQMLTINVKNFIKANEYYFNFRNKLSDLELKNIYTKNVSEYYFRFFPKENHESFIVSVNSNIETINVLNNPMLKQALMEFFNAISHLLKVICRKEMESNLNSFNIHLYRGTLDYYKAIIKDISFLHNLTFNETEKLKNLREYEYTRIGNATDRREITKRYEEFAFSLLKSYKYFD